MHGVQAGPAETQPAASPVDIKGKGRPVANLNLEGITSSVYRNGCFDSDRVIKAGSVQKRTGKRKQWKSVYLVLRPNALSLYKNEKENKLRHQIYLSDLTAVAPLKDPKHKRHNVFGLFSPSKNFHFEAPTPEEAQQWVDLIRSEARIEEEEDEMFLASPTIQRTSPGLGAMAGTSLSQEPDYFLSSSPEPSRSQPVPSILGTRERRKSSYLESSGLSGNELASHSDFSDNEVQRMHGASIESLAVQSPTLEPSSVPRLSFTQASQQRPDGLHQRTASQLSIPILDQDPDRVVWQGWLWFLRAKGGVRQWKDLWGVLRPRNLILYKDGSEYKAQRIIRLSNIVNVVDIDPLSRSKSHCLQIITEEKSYRFCAHDEESLVRCLGAFKSLLAKRRELEARAAAAATSPT